MLICAVAVAVVAPVALFAVTVTVYDRELLYGMVLPGMNVGAKQELLESAVMVATTVPVEPGFGGVGVNA